MSSSRTKAPNHQLTPGQLTPGHQSKRQTALAVLAERTGPVALAGERCVPVVDELSGLFPEAGLVRGRAFVCRGQAATSLAVALAAAAVGAGSWVLLVDVPTIGLDAAGELGVRLERVAAVDTGACATSWADVVAAAADGFDVIITRVPDGVAPSTARSLSGRLRQRGAVLLVVGDERSVGTDGVFVTRITSWNGIGVGHGHLTGRSVEVMASGRRLRERTVRAALTGGQQPSCLIGRSCDADARDVARRRSGMARSTAELAPGGERGVTTTVAQAG